MSHNESDDKAFCDQIADQETFEARFPLEAFVRIVQAFGLPPEPELLSGARRCLLHSFYFFFVSCRGEPSSRRTKRIRRLRERSAAAEILLRSLQMGGPLTLRNPAFGAKFKDTLQRLALPAELRRRRGRPLKHAAFRELTPDLVRTYERLTGKEAKEPHWLGDSRCYGGDFYRFSVAVWQCLRDRLPEVRAALPTTEGALAQELQNHWPKEV